MASRHQVSRGLAFANPPRATVNGEPPVPLASAGDASPEAVLKAPWIGIVKARNPEIDRRNDHGPSPK
jgi:hypothetical protein